MLHIGNPEDADVSHYNFPARPVERYGVHDRVALIPGKLLQYGERWEGNDCFLEAVGEVVQAQTYGENLCLTRRYSCKLGEKRFFMHDEITNAGFPAHIYLYHINAWLSIWMTVQDLVYLLKKSTSNVELCRSTEWYRSFINWQKLGSADIQHHMKSQTVVYQLQS
jgi:hypothetical protein